jgi:hypothetical protein
MHKTGNLTKFYAGYRGSTSSFFNSKDSLGSKLVQHVQVSLGQFFFKGM